MRWKWRDAERAVMRVGVEETKRAFNGGLLARFCWPAFCIGHVENYPDLPLARPFHYHH